MVYSIFVQNTNHLTTSSTMKSLKFILVSLACLCSAAIIYAEPEGNQNPQSSNVAIFYPQKGSQRPNAPTHYFIKCYYSSEYLNFLLPNDIQYLSVSILDNNETSILSCFVTAEDSCVDGLNLSGEYTVICVTDDNRAFSAYIDF